MKKIYKYILLSWFIFAQFSGALYLGFTLLAQDFNPLNWDHIYIQLISILGFASMLFSFTICFAFDIEDDF